MCQLANAGTYCIRDSTKYRPSIYKKIAGPAATPEWRFMRTDCKASRPRARLFVIDSAAFGNGGRTRGNDNIRVHLHVLNDNDASGMTSDSDSCRASADATGNLEEVVGGPGCCGPA